MKAWVLRNAARCTLKDPQPGVSFYCNFRVPEWFQTIRVKESSSLFRLLGMSSPQGARQSRVHSLAKPADLHDPTEPGTLKGA